MSVVVDAIEGPLGAVARWSGIDWPAVRRHVSRLQTRIVKAVKAGQWHRSRSLQLVPCSPGASRRLIKA
jgi:RNA-directed DNA polymerase